MKTAAERNVDFARRCLIELCHAHGADPKQADLPFLLGMLGEALRQEAAAARRREARLIESWARDSRDVGAAVYVEINGVPHVVVDGETCRVDLVSYRLVPVPGLVRCGECGGEPGSGARSEDNRASTDRGVAGRVDLVGCGECCEWIERRRVA